MKCTKIDCFEKHEDDITKLNLIQSQSADRQREVSATIINSARLTPDGPRNGNAGGTTTTGADRSSCRRRAQFKNCNETEQYQFIPTAEHLIYTNSGRVLAFKSIARRDNMADFTTLAQTSSVHEKPVLHVAISAEGWLVCTCSEDSIFLWKWDSLLKNWDKYRVGVGMYRITSVAVCFRARRVYVSVGHPSELIVIECVNENDLNTLEFFNLVTITKYAVLDKLTEVNTWLSNVFLEDVLHVIGFSTNLGVALKVYELGDRTIKQKFRAPFLLKTLMAADVLLDKDMLSFYAVGISFDGYSEVFSGSAGSLTLINRIRIEEFLPDDESNFASVDFRVLSAKFFPIMELQSDTDVGAGVDAREVDNSLSIPKPSTNWCSKLHAIVVTTKGISVVNIRSGDCELQINYSDLEAIGTALVSNAQLAMIPDENEVVVAVQPFLQNSIFTFRIMLEKSEDSINPGLAELPDEISLPLSLVPTEALSSRSVLRKKIRSPCRPASKSRNRLASSAIRMSPQGSSSRTLRKSSSPSQPEFNSTMVLGSPVFNFNNERETQTGWATKLGIGTEPTTESEVYAYSSKADRLFDERSTKRTLIETKMSDSLSYLRMAFTNDGNYLAMCGSTNPLVVLKINPKCQGLGTYRDSARMSSVGFSFSGNYMILATNDGKTSVVKWKNAYRQLFTLEFNSKFNEHIHAQFYYMDKFVLQPEDNRIALYACRMDEGGPALKLKAGSFATDCQNITALAAANQLYSNLIFYAGSNKTLNVFDANAEKFRWTAHNAHSKNITCIRLNEAPKGSTAMSLFDFVLTGSIPAHDPIKLWDLRMAKCAIKIADLNLNILATNFTRPGLSPCGRYISSGFEEKTVAIYDLRKINSRFTTFRGLKSSILDTAFDPQRPMLWVGCRSGSLWNFTPQMVH